MINVCDINVMKPLLAEHGFHFSKAKGQNFLTQKWVPESIAMDAGVDKTAGGLEIGPGIGTMTQYLAESAREVVAVEIDKNLIPNSQRNYFNETPARINLEEQLRVFFYEELHRLYHVANETKNHYKKLEVYNEAVAKLQEKHA